MNRTIGLMLLSASASILWPFSSPAFETSTHRLINQRAAESLVLSDSSETFDDFLRYQLLFPDGHGTIVNGQSIRE